MSEEGAQTLECDLVMKGGVTSGIVYPSAIAAIAKDYRLRSVGGTSAGAIGAAAAAAMEFGRRSGRNPDACAQLASLSTQLGEDVDGSPRLLRLFQPDPSTAGLFNTVMHLARAKSMGGALAGLLLWPFLIAATIMGLATYFVWRSGFSEAPCGMLVLMTFLFLAGTLGLGLLFSFIRWAPSLDAGLSAVAANGFGFCSGMETYKPRRSLLAKLRGAEPEEQDSLSLWLHKQFQALAGLDEKEVLTFGDLWVAEQRSASRSRKEALCAASGKPVEDSVPDISSVGRDIDLALVASDINRAQSVQLPFMRSTDRLYARISDLRALFPCAVVCWMTKYARTDDDLETLVFDEEDRKDFIRLPRPQDLPVLFGVRMSLSFPFLFRAVRLYVVRRDAERPGEQRLAEIWLADGGITSNFPIHLFDSPVPTRPTFCLNLLYHDDELEPDVGLRTPDSGAEEVEPQGLAVPGKGRLMPDPDEEIDSYVYMLRTNRGRLSTYTPFEMAAPLTRLIRFGGRIVTTARQWGDNQLIDVPGYRDRIVHVRMLPEEGGFNFDMGAKVITRLQKRGHRAGEVIATRFKPKNLDDPQYEGQLKLNWANHRFVRFRSFISGLEVAASRFSGAWHIDKERSELETGDPRHASPSIEDMAETLGGSSDPSKPYFGYGFDTRKPSDLALNMVEGLIKIHRLAPNPAENGVDRINGKPTSPRPKGALKLRPPSDSDPLTGRP